MTAPYGRSARWTDLDRPPLAAAALRRALVVDGEPWRDLHVVEATGSTNADLVAAARDGKAEAGTVLVAEEQTAGRGRLGRGWSAPPRSGVFVSVLLEPSPPPETWSWLPLLAGVATAGALARAAGVDTALKWPNDLLVTVDGEERKAGGILAERTTIGADRPAVVIGVGVNVSLRAEELPQPRAGSLLLAGARTTDRDPLLRALLRALADWYGQWSAAGGDAEAAQIRPAYETGCATLGRPVVAQLPGGGEIRGTARALDPTGRLVIATQDGTRSAVDAADVIHLRV